jgi:murein DD-endopeptidase MepM/ murein hydrolase activator NlpD
MTTNTHVKQGGGLRRSGTIFLLVLSIGAGALAGKTAFPTEPSAAAPARPAGSSGSYSYGWPIKPFDRQHAVRGYFGDPRTVFAGPASIHALLTGGGEFSFHRGIDISAPDGTLVYSVSSGVVTRTDAELIVIDSGNGTTFEYWHLVRNVSVGDHVTRNETVLGRVMPAAKHVHLSELRNGRLVNPLAPGHLGPYADATSPTVGAITVRRRDDGPTLLPECLRGKVEFVAEASDTPAVPVPGEWHGLPVSPAAVSYRIASVKTGRIVVPETTAMDVRDVLPASGHLWSTYARGTHMNMPQFGSRRFWYQPGVYLYKLGEKVFDTRRLRDGVYRLRVTASDTAGNRGIGTQTFTVQNWRPGVCS